MTTPMPSETETLTALKASIEHWKLMARDGIGGKDKPLASQCALCALFLLSSRNSCKGCPVARKTGRHNCYSTPYYAALSAFMKGRDADFERHAFRMARFLESLLPKEAQAK